MQVGASVICPLEVRDADLAAFAALSGDHNPLHVDEKFAQQAGFKGKVVYGGLLVAAVSRLLGMELPGRDCLWQSLNIQFKSPLFVGDKATVIGTVSYANSELKILRIAIQIKCAEKIIAEGTAQAGVTGAA